MKQRTRMDQRSTATTPSDGFSPATTLRRSNPNPLIPSDQPRQSQEGGGKDPVVARKVQKADREKLRRDRLNEQFLELGHTLDADRPKNDKATILTDTVQVLKDLTAEVQRLKAECAALSEESRELMQEKNELREEKASLKSDIDNLNAQYQQRVRVMFPWTTVDPSVVMARPYSYPIPMPIPPGTIPMHPSMQPFPFFGNQNPGAIPSPCSTFIPYPTPPNPPPNEPQLSQYASSSHSSKQESKTKTTDPSKGNDADRCVDSNDVATDLELKMPGSSGQQDSSRGEKKGKQSQKKERNITNGSTSTQYSSSLSIQDSSSNSVGDLPNSKNYDY